MGAKRSSAGFTPITHKSDHARPTSSSSTSLGSTGSATRKPPHSPEKPSSPTAAGLKRTCCHTEERCGVNNIAHCCGFNLSQLDAVCPVLITVSYCATPNWLSRHVIICELYSGCSVSGPQGVAGFISARTRLTRVTWPIRVSGFGV